MRVRSLSVDLVTVILGAAGGLGCDTRPAADSTPDSAPHAADNTALNKGGQGWEAKTPFRQAENATDLAMSAEIRREIMTRGNLSMNAQNVKVMTDAGVVTLRGVVDHVTEMGRIGDIAHGTAGVSRVDNELELAPP